MRTTEERLRAARKRARALDRARKNRRITALCGGGAWPFWLRWPSA